MALVFFRWLPAHPILFNNHYLPGQGSPLHGSEDHHHLVEHEGADASFLHPCPDAGSGVYGKAAFQHY
jgi:hypothetical protein